MAKNVQDISTVDKHNYQVQMRLMGEIATQLEEYGDAKVIGQLSQENTNLLIEKGYRVKIRADEVEVKPANGEYCCAIL
jgi:hypothetical protein